MSLEVLKARAFTVVQFAYAIATNLYSIPAHVVWMLCLAPLRFVSWGHGVYWTCEAFLFNGLLSMVATWFRTAGYTIVEMGDDIRCLYDQRVLLLANHQSTADVPTIMAGMYHQPGVGGRSYWIMDYVFRYTHFGLVSTIRGDFFILEGKKYREQQMTLFRDHLHSSYMPNNKKWLVLFPEGGFLRNRREPNKIFAEKNNYPIVNHVTLPRTGAMKIILDALVHQVHSSPTSSQGGHADLADLDWVVDLTIAYPNGKPLDLIDILCATHPPCEVVCHYRAYSTAEIPKDSAAMTKWLYDRYKEKDDMLQQFYTSGKFPDEIESKRKFPLRKSKAIDFSWMQLVAYQTFYIMSTCIHVHYLYRPVCSMICNVFT